MHFIKSRTVGIFWTLSLAALVFTGVSCTKKDPSAPSGEAASTGVTNQAATTGDILVGDVGSMTGSEATFGKSTSEGILLAIEEVNAAGGVNGRKIKVLSLDNQGKPEEAAMVTTKLVTQDKVVAVLGEVASGRSLAMAPIAQANRVPMITPSSTNPKVTQVGDYIFRVCFIDPFQGTVMAKFAAEKLKFKRVAILRDMKSDYSIGLAEFFAKNFKALGGTIIADESYTSGDVDFKSQLTSLKTKNPEAIFVPGYYTEVGLIARQAKEIGLKAPLLGGDGWDSDQLTAIAGTALDGSYFSNHYSPDDVKNINQKAFVENYKKRFGKVPNGLAAMGYDAAKVLVEAMKRAKSLNGDDLRDAIAATKDFPGVTGNISIDGERNAVKSAVVLEIKNKEFVFADRVDPLANI